METVESALEFWKGSLEDVAMSFEQNLSVDVRVTSVVQEDVQKIAEELEPVLRPLSGTTLLLTGGCGFLCSYFLDTIACLNDSAWEKPCRMLCVDNLKSGHSWRIDHLASRSDFRFIQQDISKPFQVDEAIHWVIHGASIASPMLYRKYPLEVIAVNVYGTHHVLELARAHRLRSFLYLSTSEIYGDPSEGHVPTAEDYRGNVSCTGPRACYDESKRLAETFCTVYQQMFDVPIKIVRPFNVYGPAQRLDDQRIIPDLMTAALHRRRLVLYSDGQATRSFCYISDAIRAMWHILLSHKEGEVFNVGNDQEEISIRELAERMCDIAGLSQSEIEYHTSQDPDYLTDNPRRRCPDLTKLRTSFSWEPKVSLEEGLRRTLQSYQALGVGK